MSKRMSESIYRDRYGLAADFIRKERDKGGRFSPPWNKAYYNIRSRCLNTKDKRFSCYGGRGITTTLLPSDLRESFMRCKAYNLEKPSVDRIDPDGNYTTTNIRWVEMEKNRKNVWFAHPKRKAEYRDLESLVLGKIDCFRWSPGMKRAAIRKILSGMEAP